MNAHELFSWCHQTAVAVAIRESLWLFPIIQIVHLLALAVLGGAVLVVDLRLLGLGLRGVAVRTLAREMSPWMTVSLAVITVSGAGMFLSEALLYYGNAAFAAKMAGFGAALAFTYGVRRRWTAAETDARGGRLVAVISITLWTSVAGAGRAIGFW